MVQPMCSAPTDDLTARAFALHQAGDYGPAEGLYRDALANRPDDVNALHLLGLLLLSTGRVAEALPPLRRAVAAVEAGAAAPGHAVLYNNLGNALLAAGKGGEAVAAWRRGLGLDPDLAELHANLAVELLAEGDPAAAAAFRELWRRVPDRAEDLCRLAADGAAGSGTPVAEHRALAAAWMGGDPSDAEIATFARVAARVLAPADLQHALGRLALGRGDADAAEGRYRAALALRPDHVSALAQLAALLLDAGRHREAAEVCARLLGLVPDHLAALCALGDAHAALGEAEPALAAYRRCLAVDGDYAPALRNLGRVLTRHGRPSEALSWLERAVVLAPGDASAHAELGNTLQACGRRAEAQASFRQAQSLRPLITWPAVGGKPAFTALMLSAPGAGNTPVEYLVGRAAYDAHFVNLLPGLEPDIDLLRHHGEVVVNLISDADEGRAILPAAAALVERLGKPTVNPPDRIQVTGREAIANALAGLPHCRVPLTERLVAGDLAASEAAAWWAGRPWPLLARPAGTHGGDDFACLFTPAQLAAFVGRRPGIDHYLIEYVDYRSPDGYFRKYRLFFVGDEILPYHLAIGEQWKVHYFRTAMDRHAWMQAEEAAFLADPASALGARGMAALDAVRAAIGLDFFGIDCALDPAGDLLVFEANATMLVHDDNAAQPYKTPYAARIRQAFGALLDRRRRR